MKSSPYPHRPSEFLMLIPCQCLREDVRRIVGSVDVVVLHNLPLMQVIAIVVAYFNMLRPGLADAGGDMRERALGVGVNLRRGELVRSLCTTWLVYSGDAVDIALQFA